MEFFKTTTDVSTSVWINLLLHWLKILIVVIRSPSRCFYISLKKHIITLAQNTYWNYTEPYIIFAGSHRCTVLILILGARMAAGVTKQLRRDTGHVTTRDVKAINLVKPTGCGHQQVWNFIIDILPTLYLCFLYISENKQRLVPSIT